MTTAAAARVWSGTVWHERRTPTPHRFSYQMWWADLDLDDLPTIVRRSRVLSDRRWRPLRWDRGDHHGDPAVSLAAATRELVEERTGVRPLGPIRVIGHLRTWGWCFNPITLHLCHDTDGVMTHIVADVTNTPWKERHQYVLPTAEGRIDGLVVPKALHVSPFMAMDQHYRFDISVADERLTVRITTLEDGAEPFTAGVDLTAAPMTDRALVGALLRHPMLTHRVSLGIHAQAMRLWRKGAPIHRHPARPSEVRPAEEATRP